MHRQDARGPHRLEGRVPTGGSLLSQNNFRMTRAATARVAIPILNMSDSEKPNTGPATPDSAAPCPVPCCTWLDDAEAFARREPAKAVATAVGAGFLLHLLPVRAIGGALTAVAFALARPALLFLGMLKLSEICPCKKEPKD